ncbi:MAG TPA: DUF2304 domain-containing protein [Microcella sp.]|nr:DUF2304 domain-containing protein [Microcella sp.]
MDDQLIIKVLLISVFILFAIVLIVPMRGARQTAVRRLILVAAFIAAIVAIAFPQLLNDVAVLLGVGRGADLVLYVLVVVFIGNAMAQAAQNRQLQREITEIARTVAIEQARSSQHPRHEQ